MLTLTRQEQYCRVLKYLVNVSLIFVIFNIVYLQNRFVFFWMNSNVKYSFNKIYNSSELNFVSERGTVFSDILVKTEDIKESDLNIFFIETSCCLKNSESNFLLEKSGIIFNIRQACAIESTAHANKNHVIYILYSCPLNEHIFKQTSKETVQFFRYNNVRIAHLNMQEYFKETLVEGLLSNRILERSQYPLEHTSDVLRFLTLWKYGGTYIDTDVISIRSLVPLGSNFAAFETENVIGSAVLNFEPTGIGYSLLTQILNHLNRFFDGTQWSNNGPYLVTSFLKNLCRRTKVKKVKNVAIICEGFTIYRKDVFYPVQWDHWKQFFLENSSAKTIEKLKNSFIVHLWNKNSENIKVKIGSKQPYEVLASQYCPLTYSILKEKNYIYF